MDEQSYSNNPTILSSSILLCCTGLCSSSINNKNYKQYKKFTESLVNYSGRFPLTPMASPWVISSHSRSSASVVVLAGSSSLSHQKRRGTVALCLRLKVRAETMTTEKLGIKVERDPSESKLSELGVRQWPKWGCPPSKFPWTYSAKETCYLLKGKVKVYPEGCGDDYVEISAGDFVVFPKGMSCTWDVSETIDKHYNFE